MIPHSDRPYSTHSPECELCLLGGIALEEADWKAAEALPYERGPNAVATLGSWSYFPRLVKVNERLRGWQAEIPAGQNDLLFAMLGPERRTWSINDCADRGAMLQLRSDTASQWQSRNSHALTRVETA